ncbi:HD domain-containing protein [Halieaceae bacterium IMCC14734]|uniref:HD domain-containing protein n=1 Tax=Candidatus Litorirhabdus singularis TaxID=2518993 RepID=A0ABT3TD52_9GAMM|nr:HD domain-containing protein [Candidatus Litorirhabdus singularis]MCX2979711.1 HD domain-containing protein [Candidatus Litorirhabdus singularis]
MFTDMRNGTAEDWKHIGRAHTEYFRKTPQHLMDMLKSLEQVTLGFACDQLQHSLMTGTLARRDGATDEEVAIALLHDIGKAVNIPNHGAIGAELMRPYVSDDAYHAIYNHQHFQGKYYYEFAGASPTMRDDHVQESWYPLAEKLVDRWDAPAFDPDFEVDSLESFEPLLNTIFAMPARAVG